MTLRRDMGCIDFVGTFEVNRKGQPGDVDGENLIGSAGVRSLTEHLRELLGE